EEHEDHDHGPHDPHLWHDPMLMADLADAIGQRLGELSPDDAETFTEAAASLRSELEELDAELAESFGAVEGDKPFITSHAAYTYLAERYDLRQIGIAGVDPETEPSPQRLLALESVVEEAGVTTIFFETSASPKVARTLARNLDIDSEELDNLETQQSPDSEYPRFMRDNCARLVASWTCTPPPPPSTTCPCSPLSAGFSVWCTTSTCGSRKVSRSPCWAPPAS